MSKKQKSLPMLIIFLIIAGVGPIISGPYLYFGTNEPLYLLFPLVGIGATLIFFYHLKNRKL